MTWYYAGEVLNENLLSGKVGFVYQITNLSNDMKYIGKKLLKFRKTKQVKGIKKKISVDSDWKSYWSSSDELKKDVVALGEHQFKREILRLCSSKSECNYYEAKFQFENEVLEDSGWYNQWIMVKVRKSHITPKLTLYGS